MTQDLLSFVERLRAALESVRAASPSSLAAALGVDESGAEFQQAMRFMHARDEFLVDLAHRTLHSRRKVIDAVLAEISAAPQRTADLTVRLQLSTAVIAEAAGWLEREGRVESIAAPDGDILRLRRGSTGPQPLPG